MYQHLADISLCVHNLSIGLYQLLSTTLQSVFAVSCFKREFGVLWPKTNKRELDKNEKCLKKIEKRLDFLSVNSAFWGPKLIRIYSRQIRIGEYPLLRTTEVLETNMLGSLSGRLDTSFDIVKLYCLWYAVKATVGGGLSDQLLHSKN